MRMLSMIFLILFSCLACTSKEDSSMSVVKIKGSPSARFLLQPETEKFQEYFLDSTGNLTISLNLSRPVYYQYIDSNQHFRTLFMAPGSETIIKDSAGEVTVLGTYAKENAFMKENPFLGYSEKTNAVDIYGEEWLKLMNEYTLELMGKLTSATLDTTFTKQHRLYYQWSYVRQQLTGPEIKSAFSGHEFELADNFYQFIETLPLNDSSLLSLPKYFSTLLELFERMEKEGVIEADPYRYMAIYGEKIQDPTLRSSFLIDLVKHTFDLGYNDNLASHFEQIEPLITTSAARAELPALKARFAKATEANKTIVKGEIAPKFEAVDKNGKVYKSDDFAGKIQVIDFWYTGCIPCRAEMPHLEKIAHEMQGEPIQFISMSLDRGKKPIELWKSMIKGKSDAELHLNLPGGYKADLVKKYLIQGVPRIVIVDKEGKIVTAYASRPSNPKLKVQLQRLLEDSNS